MKVLLFDVDGTLIRAGGAGRKALSRACEALYGAKDAAAGLDLAGRTDRANFRLAFRAATGRGPINGELEALHRAYLRRLPHFVRQSVREGRYALPRGIGPLLRRLSRERGVLLGLGTGNLERGAWIKLKPSGLGRYFAFGGFGSDAEDRAAILRMAVRRARALAGGGLDGAEVFVIGDTPRDVAAGKKAGFRTIAVGTGFAAWKELVRSKPDHLARDYRGLSRWLRWLKLGR